MTSEQEFLGPSPPCPPQVLASGSEILNRSHWIQIRLTFQHIDSILNNIEQILAGPDRGSPFSRYVSDITPVQRRIAGDYIARVRATMTKIMREQAMEFPEPQCGTRWGALTAALGASISAEELTPDRMRGYGEISVPGRGLLEAIGSEMGLVLGNLQTYLEQCANRDLEQRIERIKEAGDDARIVEELDRIITTHGLVEYRNSLTTIVDKIETKIFEVGIFGRVNSGKSSLLNYLLEADYLPVDVTPVTAVPTRIGYGTDPQVKIEFADRPSRIVSFSDLWEFATENGNPNNMKHVTRIRIELPSPRLREGIVFVDTPGLGALATSGSIETLIYLPRCDLGILMLEASAGISAEDYAVLDALGRAGSSSVILISKSDLFDERERQKLNAYVTDEVKRQLATLPPIFPVSVLGESAVLSERWFREYLEPMLERHQQLALASTRRKIAVLRNAIISSLEGKFSMGRGPRRGQQLQQPVIAEEFRNVEKVLESSLRGCQELSQEIEDQFQRIIEETAKGIVTKWLKNERTIPSETMATKVSQSLARPVSGIAKSYGRVRAATIRALEIAEKASPKGLSLELPVALGMPPLDPATVASTLNIRKPPFLSAVTGPFLKRQLEERINRQAGAQLRSFLSAYSRQIRQWFREAVGNLRAAFESAAAIYRVETEILDIEIPQDKTQLVADLEQLKQQIDGFSE